MITGASTAFQRECLFHPLSCFLKCGIMALSGLTAFSIARPLLNIDIAAFPTPSSLSMAGKIKIIRDLLYLPNSGKTYFMTLYDSILSRRDQALVPGLSRFFKCGPGQYGEGDKFLGIKVPVTREVVRACWRDTDNAELEKCISSEYHEVRLAALLTLVEIFRRSKRDPQRRKYCIDFYLAHLQYINNWDLVDLSCYPLLGEWLMDKDRTLLHELARNGKTIWERRIGIVSTMTFVRAGQLDDTYSIAGIFLEPSAYPLHDLLQKAVGWLLREAGKRDPARLEKWLGQNAHGMPRVMLRYAIEKFPPEMRLHFLKLRKSVIFM